MPNVTTALTKQFGPEMILPTGWEEIIPKIVASNMETPNIPVMPKNWMEVMPLFIAQNATGYGDDVIPPMGPFVNPPSPPRPVRLETPYGEDVSPNLGPFITPQDPNVGGSFVTPQVPNIGGKFINPIVDHSPTIEKSSIDPLEQEARKYKSAENNMNDILSLAEGGKIHKSIDDIPLIIKAIKSGEIKASSIPLGSGNSYETGYLTERLKKSGIIVDDDKMGNVFVGKNQKDIDALKSAKNPYEYGKAYGYSEADIARFYLERRGGNSEIANMEYLKDSEKWNKAHIGTVYKSKPVEDEQKISQQNFIDIGKIPVGGSLNELLGNVQSYESKDYGTGREAQRGIEAEQEVRQQASRIPQQKIVTKSDAISWIKSQGIDTSYLEEPVPKSKRLDPTEGFNQILNNPQFLSLNAFDRARVLAQLERPIREEVYSGEESPKGNRKTSQSEIGDPKFIPGRPIRAVDAIRGCANNCLNCYGLGGASQGCISHGVPVKAQVTGTFSKGEIIRWGEKGDPASDWKHTNSQVDSLLERSRQKKGNESLDPKSDMFSITKLQKLQGYDPEKQPNLEVSLDPLYPEDMIHTISGVKALKDEFGDKVNIVFRIRSFASNDEDLKASLDVAVNKAKEMGIKVLETKMRFKNKLILDALNMDKTKYKQVGAQSKLIKPVLRDKVGEKNWAVCDEGETGKCQNCRNCEKLMFGDKK